MARSKECAVAREFAQLLGVEEGAQPLGEQRAARWTWNVPWQLSWFLPSQAEDSPSPLRCPLSGTVGCSGGALLRGNVAGGELQKSPAFRSDRWRLAEGGPFSLSRELDLWCTPLPSDPGLFLRNGLNF